MKTIIDEYWTWEFYGYHSDELSYGSGRPIVARCDECCRYRVLRNDAYRDLCLSCVRKRHNLSDDTLHNLSESHKRHNLSDESRHNLSVSHIGVLHTDATRLKMSKSLKGRVISYETRKKSSATLQGMPYEDWNGFVSDGEYCHKFNNAKKEETRTKYDHRCFMCDKPQDENMTKNGKQEKLCCHHTDLNKDAGCDDHEWRLVPLCKACHSRAHGDPMKSRIEYLRADE